MSNETNPSHGNPPNLKTFTTMRDRVILVAMKYEDNFGDAEEAYTSKTLLLTTTRLVRYGISRRKKTTHNIANAFFGATPQHPLIEDTIN